MSITVDGLDYVIGSYGDFADSQEFICWRICNVGISQVTEELDYPSGQDFMQDIFEYANRDLTYFDDLVEGYYLKWPEGGTHGNQ